MYFEEELHNNRENPKTTWDVIETLLPSKNKSWNYAQDLHDFASDNQTKQAKQFYEFFCTIGEKLVNNVSTNQGNHFQMYLAKRVAKSMHLATANITESVNTILSLNVSKAVIMIKYLLTFLKLQLSH